jgi:hypothetical protein
MNIDSSPRRMPSPNCVDNGTRSELQMYSIPGPYAPREGAGRCSGLMSSVGGQ